MAFANNVLPVPGGPQRRIPFGGFIPILLNNYGFVKGNYIVYLIYFIWSFNPPTSTNLIPGALDQSQIILYTTGSTYLGNILITVNVVESNATLVPAFKFFFYTVFFQPTKYLGPCAAFIIIF